MDETEQRIIDLIEEHRQEILDFARDIEAHPEPGFQEVRTAKKTAELLKKYGYDVREEIALTGVRGDWSSEECASDRMCGTGENAAGKGTGKYPNISVIGEMDAIGCRLHPKADTKNGTAHACGHHAQMAVMAGAAMVFADAEIRKQLTGSLTFFAVPAEEYIDADKRTVLRKQGIRFGSGKSEMIRMGEFDNTDLVMTTHVHMVPAEEDFYLGNPACNGFTAERVTVRGKAAHAAIDPWNGVNALSITSSAIQMMGLMRETFREEDHVRLHNVIRKAGDVVNSVPDEAVVETKIRASSLERIQEVQEMIDRAYDGAAYAFGGKIERERIPGYMPVRQRAAEPALIQAAEELGVSFRTVKPGDFNNACTDMGDLTQLFPVVNFTFRGFEGRLHGEDFRITDEDKAYILPTKLMALTIYRLLRNDAREAKKIADDFTPVFDKKQYIEYIEKQM